MAEAYRIRGGVEGTATQHYSVQVPHFSEPTKVDFVRVETKKITYRSSFSKYEAPNQVVSRRKFIL